MGNRRDMVVGTLIGFASAFKWPALLALSASLTYGLFRLVAAVAPHIGQLAPWFAAASGTLAAVVTVAAYWGTWGDRAKAEGVPVGEPSMGDWTRSSRTATMVALLSIAMVWLSGLTVTNFTGYGATLLSIVLFLLSLVVAGMCGATLGTEDGARAAGHDTGCEARIRGMEADACRTRN